MPVFEYVLLALLGAAGAATPAETPSGPSLRTLTADIVTQPSGGVEGLFGQNTGGSTDKHAGTGRKGRHYVEARRRHRGPRHTRVNTIGKKPSKI
jgi:hypothetical protein